MPLRLDARSSDFAERFEAELRKLPVWLFSSGPLGDPAKPTQPPAEGLELAHRLNAVDHQVFEGRLERGQLGLGERTVVRMVGAPTGDYRPWLAIGAWARRIAISLEAKPLGAASRPSACRPRHRGR